MKENFIIPQNILEHIEGTSLYYPCSLRDTLSAVKLFAPYINDFLFVDKCYFSGYSLLKIPTPKELPGYRLISRRRKGPVRAEMTEKYDEVKKEYYLDLEPCIVTETYIHEQTGKTIKFRLKRGFGEYTLRNSENKYGVFYYRGDTVNEGGSGITWLNKKRLSNICSKLIDGGLIVTDGSNRGRRKDKHNQFWKYHFPRKNDILPNPEEMISSMEPFKDKAGRTFTCVGYAGERYGPTFIWQVFQERKEDEVKK